MDTRPIPPITPDTQPFWDGCAAGELRVQHCSGCAAVQFPPRARCIACGAHALAWQAIPARGVIYSFTIVHRAPSAAFRADVPYVVALVDLAPGARLMVNVVDCAPEAVAIGMAVQIGFQRRGVDEDPVWLPVARASG